MDSRIYRDCETVVMKIMGRINEPPHGKTNNLQKRKQRRRSASR